MSIYYKKTKYVAIFFIYLTGTCFARIGETLEKCKERYGEIRNTEIERVGSRYSFLKEEVLVSISVYNNKVYQISYSKPSMTIQEANALLEVNGINDKFSETPHYRDHNGDASYLIMGKSPHGLKASYKQYYPVLIPNSNVNFVTITDESLDDEVRNLRLKEYEKEKSDQAKKLKDKF
jgi:hypothetical protein